MPLENKPTNAICKVLQNRKEKIKKANFSSYIIEKYQRNEKLKRKHTQGRRKQSVFLILAVLITTTLKIVLQVRPENFFSDLYVLYGFSNKRIERISSMLFLINSCCTSWIGLKVVKTKFEHVKLDFGWTYPLQSNVIRTPLAQASFCDGLLY